MSVRARAGFVHYQRQDLFGAEYGLVNSPTAVMALSVTDPLTIRADYWVAFLFKRIVGLSVLNVSSSDIAVRAYGYTGSAPSPFAAPQCAAGSASLQLLLLNIDNSSAVSVSLPAPLAHGSGSYAAWSLTPTGGNPFSMTAQLNGQPLPTEIDVSKVDPATFLSSITVAPRTGRVADGLVLQPMSVNFVCY
jgi:hypothetical protein